MAEELTEKQRTIQQNKALHVFYTLLAVALNEAGFDVRTFPFKRPPSIPWSGKTVKEYLWRPVQRAQLLKSSTTELTTKEVDVVYDTLNKHIGEATGVHIPFPSLETIALEMEYGKLTPKKINHELSRHIRRGKGRAGPRKCGGRAAR